MQFEPISKELVSDKIIQKIKEGIDTGQFKKGERLPSETEMAMNLKVGRSSVREALKVLIHLGILERKGRHTFIASDPLDNESLFRLLDSYHSHQNVLDMIEVRRLLEIQICEFAAERSDDDDIKDLEDCLSYMQKNVNDIISFINADQKFHFTLAKATKNKVLIKIIESIRMYMDETVEVIIRHRPEIIKKSLRYHQEIYKTILHHQPKKAQKIMKEHLQDIESEFKAIIKQGAVTARE